VGCRRFLERAPTILDSLDAPCREHLESVRRYLDRLEVPYRIDPLLVRGLDYYVRTTFEILGASLGAQNALLGGGRYDHLVRELGGPEVPGFGFASGLERLVLARPGKADSSRHRPDCFVAALGESAHPEALRLARDLRRRGLWVELDPGPGRSGKSQTRRADQLGARRMIFLGDDELAKGTLTIKDMAEGTQSERPAADLDRLVEELSGG
jgi:histidyl-tRNA synthetase